MFYLSVKPIYITDRYFTCQCMPNSKKTQCWQVFYLSGNEILIFFRKIFIFRYHWQVKYLSAIESFNHLLPLFFWVWQVFFLSVHEFSLLFDKPDKLFSCQLIFLWLVDKQKACQCSFSTPLRRKKLVSKTLGLQWQAFCLSVANFKSDWQAKACQ